MSKTFTLIFIGFAFIISLPAFAADQQDKMKSCNKEAKEEGLKGDERKTFMSKCLKSDRKEARKKENKHDSHDKGEVKKKSASPAQLKQREKMKACNAKAKVDSLKGKERKEFMSKCLKKNFEIDSDD